jgi:hypothetical protein
LFSGVLSGVSKGLLGTSLTAVLVPEICPHLLWEEGKREDELISGQPGRIPGSHLCKIQGMVV